MNNTADGEKQGLLSETVVYAARVKNSETLKKSSSGGAFTALSDVFLENGDAVACTVYNYQTNQAEFRIITTKEERSAARGSKYMQSITGDIFRQAEKWLSDNPSKKLLFVGMGCQAAGFQKFAEIKGFRNRVTIVDIICHGVPSPVLWKKYAEMLEQKGRLTDLTFKDKRNGWNNPTAVANVNGKEVSLSDYVRIFYNKCALRPSCHKCPYTTTQRTTDITIGDYWHIEDKLPQFFNPMGNSLILIHTDKGKSLFELVKDKMDYCISNTKDCLQFNLERPTEMSPYRKSFWNDYHSHGIEYTVNKYGKASCLSRLKKKLKKIIKP